MVLFSGDDVKKPLGALSGGEAARLVFCRRSVEKPNVLVLDEPTNHLDLEAIEALVEGLKAFDGTLIFVSHDRWFVSQLATRIVEISEDGIEDFTGTYDEYLEYAGDDHLDADSVVLKAKRDKSRKKGRSGDRRSDDAREERERKKRRQEIESRIEAVTREVETSEARVHEINEIFCDPTYFEKTPHREVQKLEAEQNKLNERLEELMEEWEGLEEELAGLEG